MFKKGRTLAIMFMAVLCSVSLFAAVACGESEGEENNGGQGGTTATYTLTYAPGATDATGEVAAEKYAEGAQVTLKGADVFTREGYTFGQWSDGSDTYAAGASFTMPARDVTLTAQWTENAKPLPDGTVETESVPAGLLTTENGSATAVWLAEYADGGVQVTAWVTDPKVYDTNTNNIYANDGVEVIVAKAARAVSFTDQTISVLVDAAGRTEVKNLGTDETLTGSGVTAEAKYFTLDKATVAGYRITVTVPYALTGVDKAAQDATLALCFTNASNAANGVSVCDDTYGTDRGAVHTYMVFKDGTLSANTNVELGSVWGDGGDLRMTDNWDLEHDTDSADAYIEMLSNKVNTDNNIYMKATGDKTNYYAEVKLTVEEVCKKADGAYDGYPKFGIAIYSADGARGVFLYVDTVDDPDGNDGPIPPDGIIEENATTLGYNIRSQGGWGGTWAGIGSVGADSSVYQNGNYVTLGIYRQGQYFRLVLNGNAVGDVITTAGIAAAERAYIGLASFNLRLRAKEYKIDESAETLAKYNITDEEVNVPQPTKTIDGDLADWTEADKANPVTIPASEGRKVTVYASKDANGVYIMYDVLHKTYIDTADAEWFDTTNAEFGIGNMPDTYHVAANGKNNIGKGRAVMKHTDPEQAGGLHHTYVEVFLPWVSVPGYNASSDVVPAGFCWKTVGEDGYIWDWGADDHAYWLVPEADARMHNSYITDHGFLTGAHKTIDGQESDWADYREVELGHNAATTRATAKATLDTDGLYLLVKIVGADINVNTDEGGIGNWWKNTNLQIYNGNRIFLTDVGDSRIMIVRGEIYHTGYITDAAYTLTDGGDGDDTLIFEVFISYRHLKNINDQTDTVSMRFGSQTYRTSDLGDTYNDLVSENNLFQIHREGYQPAAPTISWDSDTGAGTDPTVTPVWNAAQWNYSITLPANPYTRDGFDFSKWSVSVNGAVTLYNEGDTVQIPAEATVIIKAVWTQRGVETVTVTYKTGYDGGIAPEPVQLEKNGKVSQLPNLERGGYKFLGWYVEDPESHGPGETVFDMDYTVETDITVVAKWQSRLDGDMTDWTEEQKSNPFVLPAANGQSVTVYAYMDDFGVYIFYDVYHSDHKSTEGSWYLNTNVEFRLNGDADKQYAAAANGFRANIKEDQIWLHTDDPSGNSLYHTKAEIFLTYEEIGGNASKDSAYIAARFMFKVGGLGGSMWVGGDWWRPDVTDNNGNQGSLITRKGLMTATEKTIDGDDSDWSDAQWSEATGSNGRKLTWAAHLGDDGLYVFVKASAPKLTAERAYYDGNSWKNQNIEIQTGSNTRQGFVVWLGGNTYHSAAINEAKAQYIAGSGDEGTINYELFIANPNLIGITPSSGSMNFKMGAQVFRTDDADDANVWTQVPETVIYHHGYVPPVLENGETWGNGGDLSRTDNWDVTHDSGAEAYIEMTENKPGTDNNIYMFGTGRETNYYASTQLTVKGAGTMIGGNYDAWPKFGVTVFSEDGSRGVIFYVDAASNGATGEINGNSVNLGYNVRANGTWTSSWVTISGKTVGANSSVYQNGQYITLGIYRQGRLFSLVLNGESIATLYNVGIRDDETAYFGIASFNLLLKAQNYSLETNGDALQKYHIAEETEDVDYLFCGDSYIDKAFFTTWDDAFGDLSAINLGVGGTKVEYWQDQLASQLLHYDPKNIIIHIGVNNLDAEESDQSVINKLDALFKGFKQQWPEVNIYYISLVDNVQFPQFMPQYAAVNAWVQQQEGIHFIDMRPHITKTDGNKADLLWFADGLHYSAQGYALLVREICEALDLPVTKGTTSGLGDITVGEELKFAPSAPFEVKDDMWYVKQSTPLVETVLPIANAYGANVYAEAKISVVSDPYNAQWGKAGLSITSPKGTYYYFIDLQTVYANNKGTWNNHYASLVLRPEILAGWTKDWDWNNGPTFFNNMENGYTNLGDSVRFDHNVSADDFITLGVAKVGSKLYFTADGHVVGLPVQTIFGADEAVAISVLNFNMELYVKDGYATTELETIYAKAPAAHGSTKTIDGDISDWTDTEKTNPFRVPVSDGRSFTVYAYMDTYGVNIFYDVVHNTHIKKEFTGGAYTHWWESTNVEFRLGGETFHHDGGFDGGQWLVSANGQRNTDEAFFKTEQIEGGKYHTTVEIFVSYVNIPGFDHSSDYIPATFGFKVEGETGSGAGLTDVSKVGLWFTDQGYDWGWRGAEVTKSGIRTGTVKKIDGDLSDWDEDFVDMEHTEKAAEAKYAGFLGADGLYLAIRIKGTNINVTATHTADANDGWFLNTNIEFFNDGGAAGGHWTGKVMTFGGDVYHTGWISDAGMKLEGDTLTFEIFISNRWLKEPTAQSTTVNFGGQLYADGEGGTWQNYMRNGTVQRKG